MSKKYFFMSGFKGSKMTNNGKKQQQQRAREVYQRVGSIKRTARELKCSKAETKRLLGHDWLDAQREKQRQEAIQKRQNKKQQRAKQKQNNGKRHSWSKTSSHSSNTGMGASGTIHSSYRKEQRVENPDRVIRTDRGVFEIVSSSAWGHVLVPVEDPKLHKVTMDEVYGIKLIDNFPKIPADLWTRWIDLCFHFCERMSQPTPTIHRTWDQKERKWISYKYENGQRVECNNSSNFGFGSYSSNYSSRQLEVTVLLCRKEDDLSQWRMLIPKQTVSSANVRAQVKDCIDIKTGERFDHFPPPGWLHAGSSHSHNTMDAFFSSTDNESELSVPGLHIVVGRISKTSNSYTQEASIVLRQLRKKVNFKDVVESDPVEGVTFHTDVLEYITTNSWSSSSTSTSTSTSISKSSDNQNQKTIGGWADGMDGENSDADHWRRFWANFDSDSGTDDVDPAFINWKTRQAEQSRRPPIEELMQKESLPTASELLDDDDVLDKSIDYEKVINHFYEDPDGLYEDPDDPFYGWCG